MRVDPRRALLALLFCAASARAQVFGPSGPELRVNTYTTGLQAGGSVAFDAFSNFLVTWSGEGPDGADSFARRFSFSGPNGAQFRVNTHTTGGQHGAQVAGGGFERFAVVWVSADQDGDSAGLYAQRFQAGAPLGTEFRVNTYTTGYQSYMDVAADGAGNFVVVWSSSHGGGTGQDVWAQRYSSLGAPLGAEFRVNGYLTGDQARPSVAVGSEDFVVTWQSSGQLPGSGIGIYGRRYGSAGAPLAAEFRVSAITTAATNPAVAIDAHGRFVVAWMAATGGAAYGDIYARRFSSTGAPLAAEFVVNGSTAGYQVYPLVSAHSSAPEPTGTFVVAWTSGSGYGGSPGIFAQRFAGDGPPVGGEFRVNTTTAAGILGANGLDHDILGNFVVAWTQGPGGSQDVFLRRFCLSLAGDANGSGTIDVADVFHLINYLFASGPGPVRNSDADGSGGVTVGDVFYLINFLFAGGPPPSCPIEIA